MSIITDGGFEDGTLGVYEGGRIERVATDRIQVFHRSSGAPVRFGNYACRFTVRQGDDPVNASGNRAELNLRHPPNRCDHNTERWYRFSVYFPTINGWHPSMHPTNGSANQHRWCVFWQVHQYVSYGSVPISFIAQANRMEFHSNNRTDSDRITHYNIPFQPDRWHDFIFHAKWHSDPNVGFVELWHQGVRVVPKTFCKTYVTGDLFGYIKYGYYRGVNVPDTASIIHDGFLIGTTQADVMGGGPSTPPPPPPTPGPQPPDPGPTPTDPPPPPPPDPDPEPPVQPPPPEDDAVPGAGVRMQPATPRSRRRIRTGHGF